MPRVISLAPSHEEGEALSLPLGHTYAATSPDSLRMEISVTGSETRVPVQFASAVEEVPDPVFCIHTYNPQVSACPATTYPLKRTKDVSWSWNEWEILDAGIL
jgi:hypothetical protein